MALSVPAAFGVRVGSPADAVGFHRDETTMPPE